MVTISLINKKLSSYVIFNGIEFLIDTGSQISIIPRQLVRTKIQPSGMKLRGANGLLIPVYGITRLQLHMNNKSTTFNWTFLVADILEPVLGLDFLAEFNFIMNKTILILQPQTTSMVSILFKFIFLI